MDTPIAPDWIAVDWGTTHMRAYAMDNHGTILARASGLGMRALAGTDFESALLQAISHWRDGAAVPILLCGMVGSRQGWQEASYLPVPQDLDHLSQALLPVKAQNNVVQAFIVPGLSQRNPFDVMRGEETQLAGYLARVTDTHNHGQHQPTSRVCLPGTHAKWVRLNGARVEHFSTAMTGELFDLISHHSLLAHSVAGDTMNDEAFSDSVLAAFHNPESLTQALFSIRAEALLTDDDKARARGRLSGLLIGAELAGARLEKDEPIALIGAPSLCRAYEQALRAIGHDAQLFDGEDLVLAGLTSIHKRLADTGRFDAPSSPAHHAKSSASHEVST